MAEKIDEEKALYTAVAVALDGNPEAMRKIQLLLAKQNGDVFPGWAAAFEYLADGGRIGRMEPRNRATMPDPNKEWENLEQRAVRFIFRDESGYPALLREIHDPPLGLYVRGELPAAATATATHSITVVGTRRGTPEGKASARQFARELAGAGFAIVSGLALGIDAEAHEGCLEADGKTIAVLARGVDRIYPNENDRLGAAILAAGGAILSEYPPGEPPYPDRFLERNRIVSGLSRGTLVVEAPARSGSLATASFALEQGRDVFVVPGPIMHPNFFGSHQLIRQGAELVTKPEEILEAFGMAAGEKTARATASASDEEKQVLLVLRGATRALDVDKIIELTKLEPRVANQTLSFLVLKGLAKETEAGYIIE